VVRTGSGYGLKALRTPLEHPQHHICEVLDEVEAIRYLDGTRCRSPESIGVLSAAVTPYHLKTPGCSESHRAKVSALRSGTMSTSA
jgi:hypothetical protein